MAVRHKNVEPAVVVHVKESDAPAEQPRIYAQTAEISPVLKVRVAQIGVKRIGIAGKVSLDYVEVTIAVVITNGYAHPRLWQPFKRVGCAGFNANIAEGALFLVLVVSFAG